MFFIGLIPFLFLYNYYPWGSDTWGHLLKAKLLVENIKNGVFYPEYMEEWYNGIQVFRYWAPLPYYILAFFYWLTNDPGKTFWFFTVLYYLVSSLSWLVFRCELGWKKSLLLGIGYAFFADNIRVLFSEGNIPRMVVAMEFPLVLYYFKLLLLGEEQNNKYYNTLNNYKYYNILNKIKPTPFQVSTLLAALLVLTHAMIAALVMIVCGFIAFFYVLQTKNYKQTIKSLLPFGLGIALSAWWFIPSLSGGIANVDPESIREFMKEYFFFPIKQMFNPFLRYYNREVFYYPLSILFIFAIGLINYKKINHFNKAILWTIFCITISMTKAFAPIYVKLPLSNLIWSFRLLPFIGAIGLFLFFNNNWGKKTVLITALLILFDTYGTTKLLINGRPYANEIEEIFKPLNNYNRVALLDLSEFGSFPSYSIRNKQVYGWAWQGAKTAPNIVALNIALEKEWYGFLFDRAKQLGSNAIVVKKDKIKNKTYLQTKAIENNYSLLEEKPLYLTYVLKEKQEFATIPSYRGIAIGRFNTNIALMFPMLELGEKLYIDEYDYEQLKEYPLIVLSGFRYHDKNKAETLIKLLAKTSKIIIDLTGTPEELLSSRISFLGVIGEKISFVGEYPSFIWQDSIINPIEIPSEFKEWNTHYLVGEGKVLAKTRFGNIDLPLLIEKDNITFIGGNLFYFAFITKNNYLLKQIEHLINLPLDKAPDRELIPVQISFDYKKNILKIKLSTNKKLTKILLPLAALDVFNLNKTLENLILLEDTQQVVYQFPLYFGKHFILGRIISLSTIVILLLIWQQRWFFKNA